MTPITIRYLGPTDGDRNEDVPAVMESPRFCPTGVDDMIRSRELRDLAYRHVPLEHEVDEIGSFDENNAVLVVYTREET